MTTDATDRRSLRAELVIPFHGAAEAARDLATGSAVLVRVVCRCAGRGIARGARAAWEGNTLADRAESLGIAALVGGVGVAVIGGVGYGLVYVAAPYLPVVAPAGAAGWIVAAWLAAPASKPDNTENDHESSTGEQPIPAGPSDLNTLAGAETWLIRFVVAAVADAETAGRTGVHLADLVDRLRATSPAFNAWDVTTLRQHCERLGLPWRRNVKVNGRPTVGIHRDDLKDLLGPLPDALAALDGTPVEAAPAAPSPGAAGAPVDPHTNTDPRAPSQTRLVVVPAPSPESTA